MQTAEIGYNTIPTFNNLLQQRGHTHELIYFPGVLRVRLSVPNLVIQNINLIYSHLFTGTYCTLATITAKECKLITGSTYAVPKPNLEEWQNLITQRYFFGGDYNATSSL